jgi:hypothetical protein
MICREEEAALQLADPSFLHRVRASLGVAQAPVGLPKTRAWSAKPNATRPKAVDPGKFTGEVHVSVYS